MYYLVADMTPAGANKTKVDVYYWDGAAVAAKAIRGWATGDMERSRSGSVRNLERIPLSECKARG